MHELPDRLSNKRLYIAHLAERLESMESARQPMNPVAYRLFARRMKAAMAGYPEALLRAQLGRTHPSVLHVLEQRRFDVHGANAGEPGAQARLVALSLLCRLSGRGG